MVSDIFFGVESESELRSALSFFLFHYIQKNRREWVKWVFFFVIIDILVFRQFLVQKAYTPHSFTKRITQKTQKTKYMVFDINFGVNSESEPRLTFSLFIFYLKKNIKKDVYLINFPNFDGHGKGFHKDLRFRAHFPTRLCML